MFSPYIFVISRAIGLYKNSIFEIYGKSIFFYGKSPLKIAGIGRENDLIILNGR